MTWLWRGLGEGWGGGEIQAKSEERPERFGGKENGVEVGMGGRARPVAGVGRHKPREWVEAKGGVGKQAHKALCCDFPEHSPSESNV